MVKNLIITLLLLVVFSGCSSNTIAVIPEDERISTEYVEGYHELVVEYGKRISNVKLGGIPLSRSETYYIKKGEYTLVYEYHPFFTLGVGFSYGSGRDHDKPEILDRDIRKEQLNITEDTWIKLEEKNIKIEIKGEVSN